MTKAASRGLAQSMISQNTTVVATRGQVSSDLGGEVAILNLKNGMYYTLDEVGAWIWNLIQEPKTVSEVCAATLDEYEVDHERCERDVLALLQSLATEELIEVNHEPMV